MPSSSRIPTVSIPQARRIAIAAQGLAGRRPANPGIRQVTESIQRMGVLQIDSVNVLTRTQYLPLFARLGTYDRGLLTRAAEQHPRRIVESWAHEASFIPATTHPLLNWRRRRYLQEAWGSIRAAEREHPTLIADVLAAITELGPVTPTALREALGHSPALDRSNWGWNWSVVKQVCEYLFFTGQVLVAGRTQQFERRFDLPERILPPEVLAQDPAEPDARRALVEIAARAHGIATAGCLADHFRQRLAPRPDRDRGTAGSRCPATGPRSRMGGAGVPAYRGQTTESGDGRCAVVTVRSADLVPSTHAGTVRSALPDRDLHPGGETRPRLLRVAVPAG